MSEKAGLINEYVCEKCGGITRTVNRDEGTTPYLTKCRAQWPNCCGGMARSSFYRVPQDKPPRWEWFKPTPEEFEEWMTRHQHEALRYLIDEHVRNGGMLLQKLDAVRLDKYGFGPRRG